MTIATANRSAVYAIPEYSAAGVGTWGVTPAGGIQEIRTTDGGINLIVNTIRSSELRSDRMISDLIRAGYGAEGTINGEMSAQNWDEFIRSAMYSDWVVAPAAIGPSSDIAVTVDATGTFHLTSVNDNALTAASFPVGGMFRATGFAQGTVIGVVTAFTSTADVSFSPLNTVIAEALGEDVTITPMSTIKNGFAERSMTVYQNFADFGNAGIWRRTPGFIASPFGITFEADAIATVTVGGQARDALYEAAPAGTNPLIDAFTDDVVASSDVLDVVVDGDPASEVFFQAVEITIENNLRSRKAIKTIENLAVVAGECDISGTSTAYFEDESLYNRYRDGTPYTMGMSFQDSADKGYALFLPRIKTTESEQTPGGSNEDIFDEITWSATRHADFNAYMIIGRF